MLNENVEIFFSDIENTMNKMYFAYHRVVDIMSIRTQKNNSRISTQKRTDIAKYEYATKHMSHGKCNLFMLKLFDMFDKDRHVRNRKKKVSFR